MTDKTLREGADSVEAVTSRTAATRESQSLQAQHTPTPWTQAVLLVRDASGQQIAHCTRWNGRRPMPEEAEANAAFIVRCVNSHDELLAALKWAMRHLRSHVSFGSNGDAFARASGDELVGFVPKWDKVEAAIAKAEGR